MEISTIATTTTLMNADSIEWCPIAPYQRILVTGQYQLGEDESNGISDAQRARFGAISLFGFTDELRLLQSLESPAVLDQKWCHNPLNGLATLAVVTADGTLDVYQLVEVEEEIMQLKPFLKYKFPAADEERLLLSVDWSTGRHVSAAPDLIVSDSLGNIHLFTLATTGLTLRESHAVHKDRAWIGAFDYWKPTSLFSGGDDSKLCITSVGNGTHLRNSTHKSGVTSVHSNALHQHVFVTGSYDAYVRIWDLRTMRTPVDEVLTKGPVWRVKWDPFACRRVLAACMDGGVAMVDSGAAGARICGEYHEHKGLAYGVDWCYAMDDFLIASCSFEDNYVCVASY